ncbi:lactonase family protein [Granulicella sp. WH15]|uniref:lactonase family protein n=1 Tax=Granulicella sp. WH15 TaxID=2602070 RepID=UPI0013677D35|nr:beta-propeller fold lactonase family protein [Granulicella sp. WH15]QHN04140.1 lactonase family protein [Granulicella sp. WH15]
MTFSRIGRIILGLVASAALGLGMTACGGGTIGYMWVLGTQPNQSTGIITGFKIDHYTGNLTAIPHSPFSSNGANPVSLVVKSGGRFVYVINAGTPASGSAAAVPGNIAVYSVGGDGTLVFQLSYSSQGSNPVWATMDSTGTYLYVLDQDAPAESGPTADKLCPDPTTTCGDITAFSVAADSGRLTLLLNAAVKYPASDPNGKGTQQLPYFPVGIKPTMVKVGSNGCVYALSDQSVYPLASGSGGQLTAATTGPFTITGDTPNPIKFSSINTGGTYVYLTDVANNSIYPLTAGASACSLSVVNPGVVANLPLTSNPVNSLTSSDGKYLYVVNQSSTSDPQTPSNSTISAFSIDASKGQLQPLGDSNNPYANGSGPTCIVEDPSSEYIYTSDRTSQTVTGRIIQQTNGLLQPLHRGSTFTLLGPPSCLVISPNVN